jgi:hypothetical protein
MKKKLLIFMLIIFIQKGHAQLSSNFYIETGENYASSGMYTDISGSLSTIIQLWKIELVTGITFNEARQNRFNAINLGIARAFSIKSNEFSAKAFYQWNPFSERLQEQTAGLLAIYNLNKIDFVIGLNTRVFSLTKNYTRLNNYEQNVIWEPVNLMYKISYTHPFSDKFSLMTSITNYDAFIIQQETNPMFINRLEYQLSEDTKLNLGVGYLQSGLMNIRVNYFGYFIRGGIQWDF